MRKVIIALLFSILILVVSSCGNHEKGTLISAAQFETLQQDKANAGKKLSIIGYPAVKYDITITADQTALLGFFTKPNGAGSSVAFIRVKHGKEHNQMFVPDKFTNEDLVVYDNEGKQLTTNNKIQISFTMDMDTKREPMSMNKTKFVNNKVENKTVKEYFGQGPIDIRIDKAD